MDDNPFLMAGGAGAQAWVWDASRQAKANDGIANL
jgi:hypothetical protein